MRRTWLVVVLVVVLASFILPTIGAAAKPVVNMWTFAANNKAEWDAREAAIEKKFNIDLKCTLVAESAFVQKLQAAMMAGKDYPDIIEWRIENNQILNANEKKCLVSPLENYTKRSKIFKNVMKGRVAWVTYGGHIYGLPHDVHPVVLIYNDTLWKSVGVDVAKIGTWDEFMAAAKKLTAEKKDGKPVHGALPSSNSGLADTMFMIWQQSEAQILDKSGKPIFTSAAFKDFVAKWKSWYDTGVFVSWDWGNFGTMLQNGSLCAYTSPDWWVSQVDAAAKEGTYQWRVRDLPLYKAGGPRTCSWGGSFMAITRLAKNQPTLYRLIENMQYEDDAVVSRYKDAQMLAPIASTWGMDIYKQPDPRFGGQKLGVLQTTLAKELPAVNSGDVFWDAVTDFGGQFSEIISGRKSIDAGLAEAQSKAMARYNKL